MKVINEFQKEYRWLSNFWPVKITYGGITYPHVESAYMAMKTEDIETRKKIALLSNPAEAKRAGRTLKLRKDWDKLKVNVMYTMLKIKFAPGSTLAAKLLDTGDALLVEGNKWGDTFWGVCNGKGHNILGKLLMQVRKELKQHHNQTEESQNESSTL